MSSVPPRLRRSFTPTPSVCPDLVRSLRLASHSVPGGGVQTLSGPPVQPQEKGIPPSTLQKPEQTEKHVSRPGPPHSRPPGRRVLGSLRAGD